MKQATVLIVPLAAVLTLAAAPGQAQTSASGSARTTVSRTGDPTHFAFRGTGYGTRVVGGQVPGGSETTAHAVIGCTNRSGVRHTNDVAQVALPGVGTAYGIHTRLRTTEHDGVTASQGRHSIASIALASSPLGSLTVDAITSQVRAFHDVHGFHATTATTVGSLSLTPPGGGTAQTFPAPTPDQPVDIPGLATIYAGQTRTSRSSTGAVADAYALRIDVAATGSSIRVGHSHAEIHGGLLRGIFGGHSAGTHVTTALDGTAESGPNPLSVMPCQGTYGSVHRQALAHLDLGGQLVVRGATASERASQTAARAYGYERGSIAHVDLGGGRLVIDGIVGQATVTRSRDGVRRSARGTELGTITVNGATQRFPATGALVVPGVAELERHLVTRSASGITVVSLRITLLDGTGGVVDLGVASMRIRPLGR